VGRRQARCCRWRELRHQRRVGADQLVPHRLTSHWAIAGNDQEPDGADDANRSARHAGPQQHLVEQAEQRAKMNTEDQAGTIGTSLPTWSW
jgi:hypothetical protein